MPSILKMNPENPDAAMIQDVADILKAGGVIAYPTETFYGLGCDGTNEKAIEKIYVIKGRSFTAPLSVIVGTLPDARAFIEDISPSGRLLIDAFWPGPLTLVFRAAPTVLPRLTAQTGKIGLRISSHPVAVRLAAALARPVTATSANLTGARESVTAAEVLQHFGESLDAVIDAGPTAGGKGSTILDMTQDPPALLREGIIPFAEIEKVLHPVR
jgi:L-threonylcarbamoyladenylate synthase